MNESMKIGLFGIGLDTYWDQFDGLKDRLLSHQASIKARLESFGSEVIDIGLIDNPEKAPDAGLRFKQEDVEIIFLFVSTYALSSTVLPVVQKAKVPVVVLNLQPVAQLDYEKFNAIGDRGTMTGVWLEHCQSCSVPGPILQIGNTNSRYKFPLSVKDFMNRWNEVGPAHHCAIGVGHVAGKIEKLSSLLGIQCTQVC